MRVLGVVGLIRRTVEGSVTAIVLIAVVALLGGSRTLDLLLADGGLASMLFLFAFAVVLADLIAKLIGIVGATFPDLIPKLDEAHVKRASLIRRLRPGQTIALLSGAYAVRIVLFLVIFAFLGASYAAAPGEVQRALVGEFSAFDAINAFLREGIAGSLGYFLFFLGPDNLAPIRTAIIAEPLTSSTLDGEIFLAGIRLYGFALLLAVLRTLVTPITWLRARRRAKSLSGRDGNAPSFRKSAPAKA